MDFVGRVRAQWADQLPDVDTSSAEIAARIARIAALLEERGVETLARHGLNRPEFDVLAALRRAGRPLRAGEVQTMTRAPGASVTKRLDRLERAGLVARTVPERDRRGVLLELTDSGTALVDELFPVQLEVERRTIADLSEAEQETLGRLLGVVLRRLDPTDY